MVGALRGGVLTSAANGDVAKWSKAVVCKTTIRRFKSARRLHLPLLLLLSACADPADPPPASRGTGSTAPWVEWHHASEPVIAPVVVFVDEPGGPMDRIAADTDVTTFLNDRFHPIFFTERVGQPIGTVRFYDGCGCPLTEPLRPDGPSAFITVANDIIVRADARRCTAPALQWDCLRL